MQALTVLTANLRMSNEEFRCSTHRVQAEQLQAAAHAAVVPAAPAPLAGLIK
ncbi:MAG: hypothetical protein SCH68_11255 [Brevefilum sp.]|nr:hypothetical protein [Brevefilum sp.]